MRYGLGSAIQSRVTGAFPLGTMVVNAMGCLAIGVAGVVLLNASMSGQAREAWRLALVVGVLGGFTTFSAYSWEAIELVNARRYTLAAVYVVGTNLLCLACAAAGYRIGQRILPI